MFRRARTASVALIVVAGFLTAAPASAAAKISNGVACTKTGASVKANGFTYKCSKNPMVKNSKLTWLSTDCISSANTYLAALASSSTINSEMALKIPVIDAGIANETANKAELQTKLDATNLRLTAANAKLAAAVSDSDKKAYGGAVKSWTAAVKAYESKIRNIDITIKKFQSSKTAAVSQPAQLEANVTETKATATLICSKGL